MSVIVSVDLSHQVAWELRAEIQGMVWVQVQLHDRNAIRKLKLCWIDWVGSRIHLFTGGGG